MKNKIYLGLFCLSVLLVFAARALYYGSFTRQCIYTEISLPLNQNFTDVKIIFIKPAMVIQGINENYSCLNEIGGIQNKIIKTSDFYPFMYKDKKTVTITPDSKIELIPIKIISVTKHGLTTIDSGPGPIRHLILKDNAGVLYQVATVTLGTNKGDEFLKAIGQDTETLLTPLTQFID